MNEVKNISTYYKEYVANLESSLRIRGRELDYVIRTSTANPIAISIAGLAFDNKKLTQANIEWVLTSFLRDPIDKPVLEKLAYLVWKDTI